MNPEPIIKAIINLAEAQIKLGTLLTKALLGFKHHATEVANPQPSHFSDEALDNAAAVIQRELLRHKELGFASLLQTNFPPDEIRRIARAALEAAASTLE